VDEPRVLAMLRDSDRLSRKKYTPANWDKTRQRVLAGELDNVWIEYLSSRLEVEADLDPVTGRQYSLLIAYPQLPDGVTQQIQDALVGALRRGAQLLRAATGYLTVDNFPCPYEAVMGCEIENWKRYEEQVRGYYWGNILSEYHIGQLGGLDAVRRDAPFLVSEDISTDGHQLVYLQSTDRLEDWPADAVVAARDYLLPLLPGGTPDPECAAKVIHVIEDAPIPERPPVPGTRYWDWLEGVRRRTGTTPPALDLDALQAEADALSPGPRRPIPQETTPELFLDSMEVTLVLSEPPDATLRSDLVRLVDLWAAQGIEGAFGGGVMDSVDRPSFHETDSGTLVFGFLADLGSAGKPALDVLLDRLEGFAGPRDLPVERIDLGHGGSDL
jgi:hypothetical protein